MKTLRYAFARTLPIMAGYLVLGLGFGVLLQSKGYGVGWSLAMSTLIYAGSMQYVTIDLLAGGASLISAALMTLMVNARHLFYGISMLDKYKGTGWKKPYLIYAMCDETFSVNYTAEIPEGVDRGWFMYWVSLLDQFYWVAASALGGLLGRVLTVSTKGIEFVMTALFVTIFTGQWMEDREHRPALVGLGASVLCLALFGAGNFILPAMALIVLLLLVMRPALDKKGAVR